MYKAAVDRGFCCKYYTSAYNQRTLLRISIEILPVIIIVHILYSSKNRLVVTTEK